MHKRKVLGSEPGGPGFRAAVTVNQSVSYRSGLGTAPSSSTREARWEVPVFCFIHRLPTDSTGLALMKAAVRNVFRVNSLGATFMCCTSASPIEHGRWRPRRINLATWRTA